MLINMISSNNNQLKNKKYIQIYPNNNLLIIQKKKHKIMN